MAQAAAGAAQVEVITLPPLLLDDRPAQAHTQGLEFAGGYCYVTARLESVSPKRAILLRTPFHGTRWDVWDITPIQARGSSNRLDHPGGMQLDGKRLWIPVAESVRHGHTLIRVFALERLRPDQAAASDLEFPVADHIGALAVAPDQQLVLGASWDTETVYVWNFEGRLQRTLTGLQLKSRNLGAVPGPDGHAGLAVQDWKMIGDRFFASGLFQDPASPPVLPKSRLLVFQHFLEPTFTFEAITLPLQHQTELAQEGMAISAGDLYYLPEDLGPTNRLFRTPLTRLPQGELFPNK